MRRTGRSLAFLVCVPFLLPAVFCTGCGAAKTARVRIGALDPVSGPDAVAGLDSLHGAELAAEVVNGAYPDLALPLAGTSGLPGLGGARLVLVHADTRGDPATGAGEAARLVADEKVVALTGAYESAVTGAASERAERLGIPFVNGDSSATALTARGLRYFFRTGPSDETFGRSFFSLIQDRRAAGVPVRSVGILHTNDEYGSDGARVTEQLARANGLSVAADVGYDAKAGDLVPYVQQVRDRRPDALFVLSYSPDALLLQQALARLGYLPPAVLGYGAGFSTPAFTAGPERAGRARGFLRRTAWSAELAARNPTSAKVAQKFAEKFGAPMTENSARAFTAVMTLAVAINEARSTDPARIRSALRSVYLPGGDLIVAPWDYVRFDASGQNTGARGVVEQFLDGQWHVVYPDDLRSRPVVWPISAARSGSTPSAP